MTPTAASSNYAGTLSLVRLALRRDRMLLSAWIGSLVMLAAVSAGSTQSLYPSIASRVQAADLINSTTSLVALYGRIYDPASIGAVATIKLIAFGAVFVCMMSIVIVVRHTRADEESGRWELLGATTVGRFAGLSSAMLTALLANVMLAVLTAAALTAAGLPLSGSLAFAGSWFSCGLVFAAVAAMFAQLTSGARAATGLSSATLGFAYILRAFADTAGPNGPRWLTWSSPIGWGQQLRPFAGDRFWVLILGLAVAVVGGVAACGLLARRDLGSGLLPDRPGPAEGGRQLRSAVALAWRLERTLLAGWLIAFALLGAVCGSIASNVGSLLNNDQTRDLIARLAGHHSVTDRLLSDLFLAAEFSVLALIATGFGIQIILRMRSEESQGHAELLLTTKVARLQWLAGHCVIAIVGTGVLVVAAGFAAGLAVGAHSSRALAEGGRLAIAAGAQLPAVWTVLALTLALYSWRSDYVLGGWVILVGCVMIEDLGAMLRLDHWVLDVSPFAHVPRLPGSEVRLSAFYWLLAISVGVTVCAFARFRRRDVL